MSCPQRISFFSVTIDGVRDTTTKSDGDTRILLCVTNSLDYLSLANNQILIPHLSFSIDITKKSALETVRDFPCDERMMGLIFLKRTQLSFDTSVNWWIL